MKLRFSQDVAKSESQRPQAWKVASGREYMSEAFITFLDEQGTARKLTVHDTPEENGVAERLDRTLMD